MCRFNSNVEKSDGCWVWHGRLNDKGYGQMFSGEGAHRISWTLFCGTIPDGIHVLHKCDNPPCVNPEHLFLGTHSDNMADKASKGRAYHPAGWGSHDRPSGAGHWSALRPNDVLRGEAHGRAKLTMDAVREIRAAASRGEAQSAIGARFGILQASVSKIILGKTWRSVQ